MRKPGIDSGPKVWAQLTNPVNNSFTKLNFHVDVDVDHHVHLHVGYIVYLHVGHHVHLRVGHHIVNCIWSIPCILGLECLAQVG